MSLSFHVRCFPDPLIFDLDILTLNGVLIFSASLFIEWGFYYIISQEMRELRGMRGMRARIRGMCATRTCAHFFALIFYKIVTIRVLIPPAVASHICSTDLCHAYELPQKIFSVDFKNYVLPKNFFAPVHIPETNPCFCIPEATAGVMRTYLAKLYNFIKRTRDARKREGGGMIRNRRGRERDREIWVGGRA